MFLDDSRGYGSAKRIRQRTVIKRSQTLSKLSAHKAAFAELLDATTVDRGRVVDALVQFEKLRSEQYKASVLQDQTIPLSDRLRFGTPLSSKERRQLLEIGFVSDSVPETNCGSCERVADIVIGSLKTSEAAKILDVSSSQVRSMEARDQLFSLVHQYGVFRFPRFQFGTYGLLPEFERVAPYIPKDLHVLSVVNFFGTPHPDLYVTDDQAPIAPTEWLVRNCHSQNVIGLLRQL